VTDGLRLDLGSGPFHTEGWVSVDKSTGPWLSRHPLAKSLLGVTRVLSDSQRSTTWPAEVKRIDVTRRFPWAPGSVSAIYSSHFVEHLARQQCRQLLEHCHSALREGGVLRIAVPDLEAGVRHYQEATDAGEQTAADTFSDWFLGGDIDSGGPPARRLAMRLMHRHHQWMYDERSLGALLGSCGFRDVERCRFREGRCPDLDLIERRPDSLFLEARR
jgi:predicted SAM-dependent methyltransferase